MKVLGVIVAAVIAMPAPCRQSPVSQPPAAPSDCSAPEHHQFDFWIGQWTVTTQGKPAGTNRIEATLKGCAVVESWTSASGGKGTSLNFYNRDTKSWHQAWMDERGGALLLKGAFVKGAMVMSSAPTPQPGGGTVTHRITWSQQSPQRVRQLWESSTDNGKTWTVAFDGLYAK